MGTLYLVSTPIGNLEDISLRALKILGQVPVIACEDTRKTGLLLARFQLKKNQELISFFEGNEAIRLPQIISKVINGQDVALVSNAGTPTISDPGFKLVRAAIEAGVRVIPLPGASAVLSALVVSGLPTDKFLFLGFLPKKPSHRQKFIEEQIKPNITTVLYLSPYRLIDELRDLQVKIRDSPVVICREMTKVYEEVKRDCINNLVGDFQKEKLKGEFTLVLHLKE